jgi:predicted GIY-YIG superfamily endonuclease
MSKELTPLKALGRIKQAPTIYVGCASDIYTRYSHECKIIETALKDYERLLKLRKTAEWADEKLQTEKKIKALVVIKERFTIQFIKSDCLPNYYGIMQIGTNPIYIKTKEEFDLLKEVLL